MVQVVPTLCQQLHARIFLQECFSFLVRKGRCENDCSRVGIVVQRPRKAVDVIILPSSWKQTGCGPIYEDQGRNICSCSSCVLVAQLSQKFHAKWEDLWNDAITSLVDTFPTQEANTTIKIGFHWFHDFLVFRNDMLLLRMLASHCRWCDLRLPNFEDLDVIVHFLHNMVELISLQLFSHSHLPAWWNKTNSH